MTAITFGVTRVPEAAPAAAVQAPRKPWYARIIDAIVESRMRQARREIALHLGAMPYTYDETTGRLVKTGKDVPFRGW